MASDEDVVVLYERWGWAPRSRQSGAGFKPLQVAVVKSGLALQQKAGQDSVRCGPERRAKANRPTTCRNACDDVKTEGAFVSRDQFGGCPEAARAASGTKTARLRIRLLYGT
jgi:hypothetical protein